MITLPSYRINSNTLNIFKSITGCTEINVDNIRKFSIITNEYNIQMMFKPYMYGGLEFYCMTYIKVNNTEYNPYIKLTSSLESLLNNIII